jgi:predicted dehydrogenase
MEQPVRIGVIGAGWFASRRHLPDIQRHPETTLAAICRRDPESLARLRDHFEPESAFTDWREMLEKCPLHAVVIATPHALHYEQAREALERGLRVLVEKPMTVRAEDARALRDLAAQKDLALGVALNPPFWAHCHRIRSAVRAGKIGQIEAVDMFWTGNAEYVFGEAPRPADLPGLVAPSMYRADPDLCGGGYLCDGGPHLISEVLWTTGLRAVRVACLMDSTPSDRRAVLSLTLENGALATITCLGNSQLGARRVQNVFAGSEGTITVRGFEFETAIEAWGGEPETFKEKDLTPVPGPVANFVDAIQERGPLFSPADHGVHVTEVIEAAYLSASTGRTAKI